MTWSVSYYYQCLLLKETDNTNLKYTFINPHEVGMPHIEDLSWISGFDWKGIYIKILPEYQAKHLFNEIKALNYLFIEFIQIIENFKFKNDQRRQDLLSNELIFPLISYARFNGLVLFCSNCINLYDYDISVVQHNKSVNFRNSNLPLSVVNNDTLLNENSKIFNLKSPKNQQTNNLTRNNSRINITRSNVGNKKSHLFAMNSHANLKSYVRHNSNSLNKVNKENINVFQSYNNLEHLKDYNSNNLINHDIFSPINKNNHSKQNAFNFSNLNGNNINNANKNNYYTSDFVNGVNYLNSEKNKKNNVNQISTNNFEFKNNLNNDISNIENNVSFYSMNISNHVNLDIDLTGYSCEDLKDSIIFSKLNSQNLIKVIDDINENHHFNYANNYNTELNVDANINNAIPKFKYMIVSAIDLIPNLFNKCRNPQFMFCPAAENKPFVIFDQYSVDKLNLKSDKTFPIIELKEASERMLGLDDLDKAETIEKSGFCGLNLRIFYNNHNNETMKDIDSQDKNNRITEYFLRLSNKNINLDNNFIHILSNIKSERFSNIRDLFDINTTEIKGRSVMIFTPESEMKLKYSLMNQKIKILFENNNDFKDNDLNKKQSSQLRNILSDKIFNENDLNNEKNNDFEGSLNGEDFLDNVDFLNHFENFIKHLDNNNNMESVKMLKNYFHRFGINSSLEVFTLPKLKNSKIADMIKINILVKIIKAYLNYHNGLNFINKIFKLNFTHNEQNIDKNKLDNKALYDDYFDFIKGKNLYDSFKIKIKSAILSILNPSLVNKKFMENFNSNLNFQLFAKNMKWRHLDNSIGFSLFDPNSNGSSSNINNFNFTNLKDKTSPSKFHHDEFLLKLIETAKNKPFLFLQIFEYHMKIIIDPLIKFKASFSKDNFTNYFSEIHLNENEPIAVSYIKPKELSYYLLSKCIYLSFSSSHYDYFGGEKNKIIRNKSESINNLNKDTKPSSGYENKSSGNNQIKNDLNKKVKPNNNNLISLNQFNSKPKIPKDLGDKNKKESNSKILKVDNYHYNNEFERDEIDFDQEGPILNQMNSSYYNNNNSSKRNIPVSVIQNMSKIQNKIRVNSNNITTINIKNNNINEILNDTSKSNILINDPRMSKNQKSYVFEDKFDYTQSLNDKTSFWELFSSEFDFNFPSVLYKMNYRKSNEKYSEKDNCTLLDTKLNHINKYLRSHYLFYKIETIKDWKNSSEILFNDIVTNDNSECCFLQILFTILIHYIYVDFDYDIARENLNKIKDTLKCYYHYRLEDLSCLNLLEAAVVEKKKYIESEEYITKCIIFSLFLLGDPRGRNNYGNPFLLYPLWKISRQTLILENSLINENFKEIFHCQDHIFRNIIENNINNNSINDFYDNTVFYHVESLIRKKIFIDKMKQIKHKKKKNDIKNNHKDKIDYYKNNNMMNLSDIILDENKTSEFDDYKLFNLNEYNFKYLTKNKYFPFPSISDIKNSYQAYFQSDKFLSFLIKNILFFSEFDVLYDEEILNKLNLNSFSIMANVDYIDNINSQNDNFNNFNYKTATFSNTSTDKSSKKFKDKSNTLSPLMYDYLNDKMSFKRNLPYGVVLTWGNNSHNETSHNVI